MEKKKFTCTWCREKKYSEDDGGPYLKDGNRLCFECYRQEYLVNCDLCQDDFEHKCTAKKFYFVLMPKDQKETGLKSGIYRGKSFPIWRSDMFDVNIEKDNVELIKPLDKNVLDKDNHTNQICPECFKKHTDDKWLSIKKKIKIFDSVIENISHNTYKQIQKHKSDIKFFKKSLKPVISEIKTRRRIQYNKLQKRAQEIM